LKEERAELGRKIEDFETRRFVEEGQKIAEVLATASNQMSLDLLGDIIPKQEHWEEEWRIRGFVICKSSKVSKSFGSAETSGKGNAQSWGGSNSTSASQGKTWDNSYLSATGTTWSAGGGLSFIGGVHASGGGSSVRAKRIPEGFTEDGSVRSDTSVGSSTTSSNTTSSSSTYSAGSTAATSVMTGGSVATFGGLRFAICYDYSSDKYCSRRIEEVNTKLTWEQSRILLSQGTFGGVKVLITETGRAILREWIRASAVEALLKSGKSVYPGEDPVATCLDNLRGWTNVLGGTA